MAAPSLKEIEWAISELEKEESSFPVYAKLANLYTVRDKLLSAEEDREVIYRGKYSNSSSPEDQPIGRYGDSEFLIEVSGKEPKSAWLIIDDLMNNLQAVNPRVYNSVLRKIKQL